jgi:antitoxin component of MazEF toxin-antitoxin module
MIKHLTAHGNSAALVVDKPVLELLKINMDTPLEIKTDGNCLIITPLRDQARRKSFRAALAKVNRKHGGTLRKLAE